MAQVTVTIGGRGYRMACDDGQEEHLTRLGAEVDARIDQLRGAFGEIGDQRLSVMAAITLADELSEVRRRLNDAERAVSHERAALEAAQRRSDESETALAGTIVAAAERLEGLARELGPSLTESEAMG